MEIRSLDTIFNLLFVKYGNFKNSCKLPNEMKRF